MVGEYPIVTHTVEKSTVINGRCDLVLGYGGHPGKKDLSFGLVGIEIKKRYGLGTTASAQLVAYLGKYLFPSLHDPSPADILLHP